jgi:hypothetical protein
MSVGAARKAHLWDFCGATPKVFGDFSGPRSSRMRSHFLQREVHRVGTEVSGGCHGGHVDRVVGLGCQADAEPVAIVAAISRTAALADCGSIVRS